MSLVAIIPLAHCQITYEVLRLEVHGASPNYLLGLEHVAKMTNDHATLPYYLLLFVPYSVHL